MNQTRLQIPPLSTLLFFFFLPEALVKLLKNKFRRQDKCNAKMARKRQMNEPHVYIIMKFPSNQKDLLHILNSTVLKWYMNFTRIGSKPLPVV